MNDPRSVRRWRRAGRRLLATAALLLAGAAGAGAQQGAPWAVSGEVYPGGELEEYLRLLQTTGRSPLYPMNLRGLSPAEVERLAPRSTPHPWAARYEFGRPEGAAGPRVRLHAPRVGMIYNSAFPYGGNDGPVWAGRGLTTVAQVGVTARYGPVSLVLAPVFFRAENEAFELVDPPEGDEPLADWRRPTAIDLPQRFGHGPYARLDPGQSSLRVELGPLAAEASTANQVWGPAMEYPLVLGPNAPGFPHVILGTARPLDLWIGRVHGRFMWGGLSQSEYSPMPADSSRRFASGLVGSFTPRGVPGLELGASRFFHTPWPDGGVQWAQIVRPLETLTKANLSRKDGEELAASVIANQIASVFFRWVLPRGGLEVYGEFASEDHRHNFRDLALEPDHNAAYNLGFRKAWASADSQVVALRAELVNGEASHLERARRQEPFYIHANMRQGHTERGQILGSPAAYGGSASAVALELYRPGGRWSVGWRRVSQQKLGTFLAEGEIEELDVQQALGVDALLFRGRWEIGGRIDGVYQFNRNGDGDASGLRAALSVGARF